MTRKHLYTESFFASSLTLSLRISENQKDETGEQKINLNLNLIIMNALTNRVQLIGRLGNDPEVKTLESGKSMATFSMATNDVYYNEKKEKVENTQWHYVVAWGKIAEIAGKYLKKGEEVAIEGKLVHRSYENGKGEKKYITEINMTELLFMGGTKKEQEKKK